ncbi:transposase, partial [Serratia ficaria]|uniref:transposase n=1 Tax=Serratia ficaria TaxID=61651 RepID=UPI003704BE53
MPLNCWVGGDCCRSWRDDGPPCRVLAIIVIEQRIGHLPPCQDSCRLELKNFRGPETTKMNTYSPERKAALIARMMPPHNQSVVQLARSEGIPANTLYAWRTQAGVGAAESLS